MTGPITCSIPSEKTSSPTFSKLAGSPYERKPAVMTCVTSVTLTLPSRSRRQSA